MTAPVVKTEWNYAHPFVNFALRQYAAWLIMAGGDMGRAWPFYMTGFPKEAWPGVSWWQLTQLAANDQRSLEPCP